MSGRGAVPRHRGGPRPPRRLTTRFASPLALVAGLILGLGAESSFVRRQAGPPPVPLTLRPGTRIVLPIQAGATCVRRFSLDLARGTFVELRIPQDGAEVEITFQPPQAAPLRFDSTTPLRARTPERLLFVAERAGEHRLDLRFLHASAATVALQVLAARPATPRDRWAARAFARLAQAEELRRRGDPESDRRALPFYAESAALSARIGDRAALAYTGIQWARVLKRAGMPVEEEERLRRSLALARSLPDELLAARAASDLSKALFDRGEVDEFEVVARYALDLWRRFGVASRQAEIENDLGRRALDRGELAAAERLFLSAGALWRATGDVESVSTSLSNLASVYIFAGEPDLALDATDEATAFLPTDAAPEPRAEILGRRSEALAGLGRTEEAEAAATESLALYRQSGNPLRIALGQRRLGRYAYAGGRYEEAARRLSAALAALRAEGNRGEEIAALQDLAWVELRRGRLSAAAALFERMSARPGEAQSPWVEAAALAGKARVERARGHRVEALNLARRALAAAEGLRHEAGREDLGLSVFAERQVHFDLAVRLLLDRHDETGDPRLLVEAFEVSERSKARRLLDQVSSPVAVAAATESQREAAESLNRAQDRLRAQQAGNATAAERELAAREVREAVLALRRAESPRVEQAALAAPLPLGRIQGFLDRETALLELDLADDLDEPSVLWVVMRDHLAAVRLPGRVVLESLARQALEALSSSGGESDSVQGQKILLRTAQTLLGSALPQLVARRWVVVADGAFLALPVGALPDPVHPDRPILASHEVVYAPSASVAVRLAERSTRRRATGQEVIAFADAITSSDDERLGKRGGIIPGSIAAVAAERERLGTADRSLDLPPLPHSAEEAKRILALLPPGSGSARLDFDATRVHALGAEVETARRLHFAVHGLPNEEHPELSSLLLSRFDRHGRPVDGLLRAHEIARLHLEADLVVLSACRSGRGTEIAGEGLVGLSQAFLSAGAARVVVSDWEVNDAATAELMSRFYDGLLSRHLTPARALQEAQLSLAAEPAWRRPYYWAAFVVQGGF